MRQGSHLTFCVSAAALLTLAGCDRPGESANAVVIAPENAVAPVAQAPAPAPQSTTPIEHVERVDPATLVPKGDPTPPPKMQTRKDFTDPPLPPELNQDGGLKPLPPRPK